MRCYIFYVCESIKWDHEWEIIFDNYKLDKYKLLTLFFPSSVGARIPPFEEQRYSPSSTLLTLPCPPL